MKSVFCLLMLLASAFTTVMGSISPEITRVRALYNSGRSQGDPRLVMEAAQTCQSLIGQFQQGNDAGNLAISLTLLGQILVESGNFEQARDILVKGMQLSSKTFGAESEETLEAKKYLSWAHGFLKDLDKELQYSREILQVLRKDSAKNVLKIADLYNTIGQNYGLRSNREKEQENLLLSEKILKAFKAGNKEEEIQIQMLEMNLHNSLAQSFMAEFKDSRALSHARTSLEISGRLSPQSPERAAPMVVMAKCMAMAKKGDSALIWMDKALKLLEANQLQASPMWLSYRNIKAGFLGRMGRNQEATQLIRNTADLLAEHNKTLSPEEANRLISEQMLTLLQNADTELEAREELLKKETQLQREEKEKQLYRLGGLVLLLLLLMAILVAIYRLRMNKNELRLKDVQLAKSMVENDYLRSRMDPHFVSNCISSAIGLVKKGDTEPAIRYMQHFEDLMRMLVKDHSREFVSLKEELDVTKNYAELEMQRLPKGLDMEIRMDENLKPEEIEMPPLILQPIIENAIKHGISGLDQRGNIRISGSKNGPQLVLEIRDNGRGFDSNLQKPASRGLKIIEERLAIFNKVSKANSSLEIRPSEQGTTVVLKMNID